MNIQSSKSQSKNKEINSSLKIQEEDINLLLHGNKSNIIKNPKLNNNSSIKVQLSLEILNEILRNNNSEEENEKINNLIIKIKENDYYYVYDDINGPHSDIVQFFEKNKTITSEPFLIIPCENLNYEIELYKIGKTCGNLKQRYAIIKDRKFYSSKKPLSQINESNKKNLKDKTSFLHDSKYTKETKDDPNRDKKEWSNKNKIYRIIINYSLGHYENSSKNNESSFFLYFDDKNKMEEVERILFDFTLPEIKRKNILTHILNINKVLIEGNLLYIIMKILSVKKKIKKRKIFLNKMNNLIHGKIFGKLNIKKNYLMGLSSQRKEKQKGKENLIYTVNNPHLEPESPIIREKKPKVIKLCEKQYSEFMPFISNVSSLINSSDDENVNLNKKSLNTLIDKYKSLKNEIPGNIIDKNSDLSNNGICFSIPNGAEIKKNYNYDYDEKNINFKLESGLCNNSKYVFFDKNKPEIKFNSDNNINNSDNNENNILSENNIYEISNIILNSNINVNGPEENNLVLIGPKIDNKKGISYKYKNDEKFYGDPEHLHIKSQIINSYNKEEIIGTIIQIYQSELDLNDEKIKNILENLTGSFLPEINYINLKDYLLFSYKINLSPIKSIESSYIYPKDYNDKICFIEFNQQHFIPNDFFKTNTKLIIELFCLPVPAYSKKDKKLYEENKGYIGYIGKLLSPVKLGYIEINYDDIKKGKYKYELQNDGIIIPNNFIIIDGAPDKFNNMNIKNIQGKDYSIGNDSYIEKVINKDFIEKIKTNQNISEEIKNKYFNVCFDSETGNDFLFRPNENMKENEFIREISSKVSNEDLEKIRNNKKFYFLPYCEQYINEKTLYESSNLKCLSDDQKRYIKNKYKPGDWIYKMPEIKVKLLSKNLGVTKNDNLLSQLIYSTGEEESFDLESFSGYNENKVMPISENNFNIFDMKEISIINNIENFQWKTGIKFANSLQMKSFVKLLSVARNNINIKKKKENNEGDFDTKKIFEFDHKKKIEDISLNNRDGSDLENIIKCEMNIEFIDFREDFQLEKDPTLLEVIIFIEGYEEKTVLSLLSDQKYNFENSLLINDEKIKNTYNKNNNLNGKKGKKKYFPKKVKLSKKKFNKGQKKIILGEHLKTQFDFFKNSNNISYEILVILNGSGEYCTLNLKKIINDGKVCNKLELPLYKKGDYSKIYGCIGIDLWEVDNSGLTFQERYEEINSKYLNEPLLILKEQQQEHQNLSNLSISLEIKNENYHFGLYEPNVFRRKILNFIHKEKDIYIDPSDMENNLHKDMDLLYASLMKKCVILPERDNFSSFKFCNIRKNYDIGKMSLNSYRKKLGLKLLKAKRHEKFMNEFRQKEWDIYLENIKKGDKNLKGIDYYISINDKKVLLNNENDANTLHNLIYIGIPSLEYRKVVYTTLLGIIDLFHKTKEVLPENEQRNLTNPQQVFNYFANQLYENEQKTNIIFSLIDNDSAFICSLDNSSLEDINMIKKIAKSFYIWADLRIGLNKKEDKYVYFIGLLSIVQKLRNYFHEDYFVFWILVALSQYMTHFHQQNPLFTNEMNYINIYGLVTKLILENHQNEIYNKFISLNFPPEFFFSKHLSTLFTDYFKGELMMRIFDILIFESSFQGLYGDSLQYLRILCAIPITLFELSKNRILACKTVSEIESIFNDLILHTFNYNKFIYILEKNVTKFYVISSFLEKWLFNNQGREWDAKREEIQNLINHHFISVYKENTNFLYPISLYLTNNPHQMYQFYFDNLDSILNSIKSLYFQGTVFEDSNADNGIMVHLCNLQQIYNNDNNYIEDFKLNISFGDTENKEDENFNRIEVKINFDSENNRIKNLPQLFFKEKFKGNKFPKFIHFSLTDTQYKIIATFSYRILNIEQMKISKIILENKQQENKYFLEFVLFKYTTRILPSDDIVLFNTIFSSPEYLHSKPIEEKLYSYSISNYSFNRNITQLIKEQNDKRNKLAIGDNFDVNLVEMFKKINNFAENEDKYNTEKFINFINNDSYKEKIAQKIIKILGSCLQDNIINLVNKWLSSSNLSIEELFYSIILVDRTLISINEKLFLLFSIAQTHDRLLFNNDDINVNKVKEMIYSLYKRFMIYFTKTDVERMIDFLLKDERLFNVKYAFVYNKLNSEKIDEFIYDKDYYEPRLREKKQFEIYFDDINKQINIFLSYLNNHYNVNSISKELLLFILTKILDKVDLNRYIKNNFDTITLVIEKDNMIMKRNYNIKYSPLKIEEDYEPIFDVKPKNPEDIANSELCYEISNLYINNTYSKDTYISFDKFKEIFFKLPYLSDLLRVSFSYISENKDTYNKEFDYFKVTIGYDNYYHGIFYYPKNLEENNIEYEYEGNIGYEMNKKIKISDTVDNIISEIIKKIDNKIKINNNEAIIKDYLKSIDNLNCYICYYINESQKDGIIKKEIGYFDSLYSYMELKNKNLIELQIIFNSDILTLNSSKRLVTRGRGYCKIFYSRYNDFIWKKCKIKSKDKSNAKLTSVDYKTMPNIIDKNQDVVQAYNI